MFECDAKLSADGVPFLMHDATLERTTNGKGTGAAPAPPGLGDAVAAGRRAAGTHAPMRASPCPRWTTSPAIACQWLPPEHRDQAHTGAPNNTPARWWPSTPQRLWQGAGRAPAAHLFQPEALAGAQARPHLPRGLLLDTLWDGWLETALTLGCVAIVCNHALWDTCTACTRCTAPAALPELHRQRRVGRAAPDRPGHRRHHHRPGGPVLTVGLGSARHSFKLSSFGRITQWLVALTSTMAA
jgi:hypothetical protein